MRTKEEVQAEISALRALEPVGKWSNCTAHQIREIIEELEFGWDDTAQEFDDLSSSTQDLIWQARAWQHGDTDRRPSEGWGLLVK